MKPNCVLEHQRLWKFFRITCPQNLLDRGLGITHCMPKFEVSFSDKLSLMHARTYMMYQRECSTMLKPQTIGV